MVQIDTMTKWTAGIHLPHLHANEAKEFLLGGTSTVDQVFLSHQSPENQKYPLDACNNTLSREPSPKNGEKFHFPDSKGLNCYQVTLSSILIISVICFLLVVCRDYIKDMLVWMEKVDLHVSFVIFLLLYTAVSYPMAWGVILLMLACGYLYGLVYGPIVVEICSTIGVAIAHVTMKKFCRNFIVKRFYNDNMTAVISVVSGKHGFKVVALMRLTPFPFGLQNSLFSLTDIPLTTYLAATSIGILPTAVLNCYMGTTLRSMNDILTDETNQKTGYIVLIVQIILGIALTFFVVRKARVELKKAVETEEDCTETHNHMPEVVVHGDSLDSQCMFENSDHQSIKDSNKLNGYLDRSRLLS